MYYTYYKQQNNNILLRYKKAGSSQTKTKVIDFYKPTLYIEGSDTEESDVSSIFGKKLQELTFDSIQESKQFATDYKDVEGFTLFGNSNYANQFIIELLEGQTPDFEENNIRIGFMDIEVDAPEFPDPIEAKWPINGVTFYDSVEDKFYTYILNNDNGDKWSIDRSPDMIQSLNLEIHFYDTEEELVRSLLNNVASQDYDILSGWNSDGFDVPYTINRAYKLFGEAYVKKLLSPFGKIFMNEKIGKFGKKMQKFEILGRTHIDYMDLYKKHTYTPRESYKLDFIAYAELKEKKLSYEESQSLYHLYREDFQKFVDYNIQDTNLLKRLDKKLGLFSLVFAMSYYSLSNFEDTLGTIKIWEQLVAKFLFNKKVAPPFRKTRGEEGDYEGAFVKEPIPGFYNWVVSFDLNSLYPHIEMQWNIGPETHVPYHELPEELKYIVDNYSFDDLLNMRIKNLPQTLAKYDLTMAPNFQFYRKDKMSFFSEIKRELYGNRKSVKKLMLEADRNKVAAESEEEKNKYTDLKAKHNNMQLGLKVLLNGGYGALASIFFLYYKLENAEAITMSGQLVNKFTSAAVEGFLKEAFNTNDTVWVAGDTDSGYFSIDHFMKTLKPSMPINDKIDVADRFCQEVLDPFIKQKCQELCDYLNCYEQKMNWEREVIAEKAIWVAKKKYIMAVWDSEGTRYKEPEYKVTGLESKKSAFPEWSRNLLLECYKIALNKDEEDLHKRLEKIRSEFDEYNVNDIAVPSSVNGLEKYFNPEMPGLCNSGAQKHVRAAIYHNDLLKKMNINRIPEIQSGDKIKYIELKMPNPIGRDVIAFDTYLPKEFNIEDYIDRDSIYESSFLSPLRLFLEAIKWKEEETITLF